MRYVFSLEDGSPIHDVDGEDLADDAAATVVAREIAKDLARNNALAKEWRVIARDEAGRVVATVLCEVV